MSLAHQIKRLKSRDAAAKASKDEARAKAVQEPPSKGLRVGEARPRVPATSEVMDATGGESAATSFPIKTPTSIRLDADLIAWFRAQGRGWQTTINKLLRDYMEKHNGR